ncbi:carbohydrate ABC transporter membrane protein 2 (CUT1 family) [Luteococcus japonicus]|uniref:Carbohydrate ABC transporter membrane protein 2 (CUT1 family) n=1 Tax=Luteococcus japonicus TaxID=33984 RepID=A0A3N1ZUV7_9ACTN|nr:carbohydrate ABC transporter permease [Luteococcus japonicus]ROR54538.1 carbohydrate ABC transporter membrane protein 2 (CUT1 family) [Luteococcus japonicus]
MSAPARTVAPIEREEVAASRRPWSKGRIATHIFLGGMAVLWLFPLLYAVLASLRSYAYTSEHGYLSFGGFTLENYSKAWEAGDFGAKFLNSAIITIPAVVLSLFFASMVAFVISRFSWKFNTIMLALFLAGNLLPPQALLIPVFKLFQRVEVPFWISESGTLLNTHLAVILVNVAFQTGFCTFVLSNYMKALPKEIYESAMVDGTSLWGQFWRITLPLCRPSLAALATLEATWIYNEFFWATVLLQNGDKFPITSSLTNLAGDFFTDNNLVAAGSMIIALPTLVIYFALQKHFVSGLTMGETKG